MSDSKQATPTFSFGAPPSENKTSSNTFGQASSMTNTSTGNTFGANSGAPTTTSSSPFGTFGSTSNTSGTSPFGTAFGQGSSAFGGQSNPSPFSLGGAAKSGSGGSIFAQKSGSSAGQPSPSIFNSGTSSSSPSIGGAQGSAGSGSPFQNLTSSQPGNILAGSTTPASSKTQFSFGNLSTTPAGPPPSAPNGPLTSSTNTFNFAKPQQPGSNMFSPRTDAPATTLPASAPIIMSNSSGDASKPTRSFGSQFSADGKTSSQSAGSSSGVAGTGSGFGLLGRSEGTQTTPSLFGELNKFKENSTATTTGAQSVFAAPTSGSATNAQAMQQNQPDGAPKSAPAFGTLTSAAPSTSMAQAPTFMMSGALPSEPSKSAQPTFKFPAATSAGNQPQSAPAALGAAGAKPGSFASFLKPAASEQPGSAPVTDPSASSAFPTLNAPSEKPTTDSTSAAEKITTTNATSTSTAPASTAAEASATAETSILGGKAQPTTSAATDANKARAAPAAADAAPTTNANQGACTTGQPPPPQSRLKNKSMEEIITSWAKDLGEYQKEFQKQADKIASWDQLIVENGEKIQKLYASTFEAERASSEVERQLSAVVSQQDELSGWLDRYEKEVDEIFSRQVGQGEGLQGPDQERERT